MIDAFEHCRAERSVQLVTVVGVPGIGKSRLVEELGAYLEADAELTTWRHGHVLSYGSGVAFFALAEIVKQECGILDSDDTVTCGAKLDAAIAALGLEGADARWVRNQVGPLVGMGAAADGSGQSEAFAGWRLFFEAMAAESPTVLVIDDLHWADDALLDFVDGLVDRVSDVPLLVVATARPELLERRPGWAGGKINALTIGLGPLSTEHTTALIGEIIDRSLLPIDAEAVLLERAGGNPLYAQEYVRALVERGASADFPRRCRASSRPGSTASRPTRRASSRTRRSSARRCGSARSARSGSATAPKPTTCCCRLERKQLVHRARRSSIAGEVEFSFTHALIREVAYSQLPRRASAQRHERAAGGSNGSPPTGPTPPSSSPITTRPPSSSRPRSATTPKRSDRPRSPRSPTPPARPRPSTTTPPPSATPRPRSRCDPIRRCAPSSSCSARSRATPRAPRRVGPPRSTRRRPSPIAAEDAVHLTYLLSDWAEYYAADIERTNAYEPRRWHWRPTCLPARSPPSPPTAHAYRLVMSGRYDEAIELADAEIARAIDAGADAAVGLMLIWRGAARVESGDEDGIADLREAVRILDEQAHPKAAIAAYNLGDMLQGLGRLDEAAAAFETAMCARRSGNGSPSRSPRLGLAEARVPPRRTDRPPSAFLDAISTDTSEWVASLVSNVRGRLLLLEDAPHEAAAVAARQLRMHARSPIERRIACDVALAARAALAVGDERRRQRVSRRSGPGVDDESVAAHACWRRDAGLVLVAKGRHQELAAARTCIRITTPWTDAAQRSPNAATPTPPRSSTRSPASPCATRRSASPRAAGR